MHINLLQAANEAGALRLAKTKLEKRLEDLEWRLQLEKRLRVCCQFLSLILYLSPETEYITTKCCKYRQVVRRPSQVKYPSFRKHWNPSASN